MFPITRLHWYKNNFSHHCVFLNLACSTTKSFPRKSFTISENSNSDIFCQSSVQTIPPTQELSDLTDFPEPKDDQLIANTDDSKPLSIGRTQFSDVQRKDPWLNIIIKYLLNDCDINTLKQLSKQQKLWVINISKRCKIIDDLLMYSDEFMIEQDNYRVFVPNDLDLQRKLLSAYHNSTLAMHRGRDATYAAISRDFYWRNLSKHVRNWVKRCPECIKFKTPSQKPGPMNIRLYQYPFHTLGIDLRLLLTHRFLTF